LCVIAVDCIVVFSVPGTVFQVLAVLIFTVYSIKNTVNAITIDFFPILPSFIRLYIFTKQNKCTPLHKYKNINLCNSYSTGLYCPPFPVIIMSSTLLYHSFIHHRHHNLYRNTKIPIKTSQSKKNLDQVQHHVYSSSLVSLLHYFPFSFQQFALQHQ
jgi:hypothetical protein